MNRLRFRLITVGIAILGFAALVFLPPMFCTPSSGPSLSVSVGDMIDVAWCIAISGTIFGLGLGLFAGSFLRVKTKQEAEHANPT